MPTVVNIRFRRPNPIDVPFAREQPLRLSSLQKEIAVWSLRGRALQISLPVDMERQDVLLALDVL